MTARPRIAYFGGTFDPVHEGHLAVARGVQSALCFDAFRFLPAGRPPHKTNVDGASATHRLEMLRLAASRLGAAFEIDVRELYATSRCYTIDTIEAIHAESPHCDISFVIGADMLAWLPKWRAIDRLVKLTRFVAVSRPGVDLDEARSAASAITDLHLDIVACDVIDAASSDIRRRVAAGESVDRLVPSDVHRYILDHGLYRDDASSDAATRPPSAGGP